VSNALSGTPSGRVPIAGANLPPLAHWQVVLLAVGVCVLVVWIIRRAAYPRKLLLTSTPGRVNTVHPVHILALLVVWLGAPPLLLAALTPLWGENSPRAALLAGSAGQLLWFAAGLAVAARTFRAGLRRGLGLSARHWLWDAARAALTYLLILPICRGLLELASWALPPDLVKPHDLFVYMEQVGAGWRVLAVVSAAVLAPLAEELFFRGLLQSMIRQYTGRPWVAIVLASLFFVAVHIPLWHTLPALFALSIALGYNYERCGRLLSPILVHALFNTIVLVEWGLGG